MREHAHWSPLRGHPSHQVPGRKTGAKGEDGSWGGTREVAVNQHREKWKWGQDKTRAGRESAQRDKSGGGTSACIQKKKWAWEHSLF